MRIAFERKLKEAYQLTETVLYKLDYLKEQRDLEFSERETVTTMQENIKTIFTMLEGLDTITDIVERLRDINEALDYLYYKNNIIVQVLHAHGL